jgi:branched-chain amino acid transport system permease protein
MKVAIALGIAALAYPFVFSNAFYLDIGVALLLAAISASAWNIVGGYAGQVSVGHCMFFGVGASLPLLFYHHWQSPPLVGVPVGIAVSPGARTSWHADVRLTGSLLLAWRRSRSPS